ncbi:MAG: hypothetical protein H7196_04430 [candidate division SR1 bacterium]|nr:hypothetical protein [candidate division SR1 bacterium]
MFFKRVFKTATLCFIVLIGVFLLPISALSKDEDMNEMNDNSHLIEYEKLNYKIAQTIVK